MAGVQMDERAGCVAVYRGAKRNCLDGISRDPDCLYYGHGKWRNGAWSVPGAALKKARRVYRKALIKEPKP